MKRYVAAVFIALVCLCQVSADSAQSGTSIEINLPSRTLSLYKDGMLLKEYPVCVGKRTTPTPQGEYRVIYKTENPYWINGDEVVSPGPQNPLGTRWIGITKSIGIHGNNMPESIGTYTSSGCIRMYNRDVEEIYGIVGVNTPVTIKYDRIRVFEDKYSGEKAVIVYPDIYRKDDGNESQLEERLKDMNVPEEAIKRALKNLDKAAAKPIAAAEGVGVFLNGCPLTCDSVGVQGEIYINYMAAEDILGLTAEMAEILDISVKELGGKIYVNLSQLVKRYGGSMSSDAAGKNVYINMRIIKINGVFAGLNHGDYDKRDLLEAETLKKLGYEHSEDTVDIKLFGKVIMKLKRKNNWYVDADNIIEALDGSKSMDSRYGTLDIKLPTFLRWGKEYYKTDFMEGRHVLKKETVYDICEEVGRMPEAFLSRIEKNAIYVDLEEFLSNYAYNSNSFGTVIDIRSKEDRAMER